MQMATLAVSIRPAEQRDAETIAALLAQLGYTAAPEEVRDRLARLGSRTDAGALVAVVSDEPVGVASYQLIDVLERSHPQCRVTTLVVDCGHRHGGVATRLVGAIEAFARERGCFRLEVTTRPSRADAAGFYAALGFRDRPLRLVKPLLEVVTLRSLTAELIGLIEHWFDDPEVQARLGDRSWIARELGLLESQPGTRYRGRLVTGRYAWVAFDEAGAAGFVGAEVYDAEVASLVGVVDPLRRGRGRGRAMLAAALAKPALQTVRRFQGHVARENTGAIRCMEAAGFVLDPDDDFGDESEVALVYERDRAPRTRSRSDNS